MTTQMVPEQFAKIARLRDEERAQNIDGYEPDEDEEEEEGFI